jgi:signal transduction histidine kinase
VTLAALTHLRKTFWALIDRQPSRLLLYLEWGMLAATVLHLLLTLSVIREPEFISARFVPANLLFTFLFGVLGLKLPKTSIIAKTIYTASELSLIYIPTLLRVAFIGPPPPLYLIVIIRSCSMFGRVGQVLTAVVTTLLLVIQGILLNPEATLINSIRRAQEAESVLFTLRINVASAFIFGVVFILLMINALISEQRSRQKLAHANAQLRQYALRIEDQATLQERTRIAREMHDAVGHSLTAQSIQLDTGLLFLHTDPDRAQQSLLEAKRLCTQALKDVRSAIGSLRSEIGSSLSSAIAKLAHDFHHTTGVLPTWNLRLNQALPTDISLTAYRIIQEALTNIAKHSDATQVSIYMQTHAQQLNLLIQDNGNGFDPAQNTTGFGLQGMQERAIALNGVFSLVSQPGAGCKVMVQLPIPLSHDSSPVG